VTQRRPFTLDSPRAADQMAGGIPTDGSSYGLTPIVGSVLVSHFSLVQTRQRAVEV
jgi:hypothetical protein